MTSITQQLKQELWRRFGTKEHPAEWDGHVYGGGKLSQRFWEYFKAIELLNLDEESVVLDIGGGSPQTGMGFFASFLATRVRFVHIIDPEIGPNFTPLANVRFIRTQANLDSLQQLFTENPEITHISCISVLEHVDPNTRRWMMQAINDHFRGSRFVATLEFHAKRVYFDHQLIPATLSSMFQPFTRFYLDEFCASPVWCENAIDSQPLPRSSSASGGTPADIPRWYPLAVRFVRNLPPSE